MLNLAIHGADGRMGTRLVALARADARFNLSARYDRDLAPSDPVEIDVLIDFSSDSGAKHAIDIALNHRAALVVGTTALGAETRRALDDAASTIPVLVAPNMSPGVTVLTHLVRRAAELLGDSYDLDLIESHHRHKLDAPSGTALRLLDAVAEVRGRPVPPDHVHCLRGGDVIGEHTLRYAGEGEYLELSHRATTRDVFVVGALRAACWIAGKPPGRYTMNNVLGLAEHDG